MQRFIFFQKQNDCLIFLKKLITKQILKETKEKSGVVQYFGRVTIIIKNIDVD